MTAHVCECVCSVCVYIYEYVDSDCRDKIQVLNVNTGYGVMMRTCITLCNISSCVNVRRNTNVLYDFCD